MSKFLRQSKFKTENNLKIMGDVRSVSPVPLAYYGDPIITENKRMNSVGFEGFATLSKNATSLGNRLQLPPLTNTFGISDFNQAHRSIYTLIDNIKKGPVNFTMFDIETMGGNFEAGKTLPNYFSVVELAYGGGTINPLTGKKAITAPAKDKITSILFRPNKNTYDILNPVIEKLERGESIDKDLANNKWMYKSLFDLTKYGGGDEGYREGVDLRKLSKQISTGWETINSSKFSQEDARAKFQEFQDQMMDKVRISRNGRTFDEGVMKALGVTLGDQDRHLDVYELALLVNPNRALYSKEKKGFFTLQNYLSKTDTKQEHIALKDIIDQVEELGDLLTRSVMFSNGQIAKDPLSKIYRSGAQVGENSRYIITKNLGNDAIISPQTKISNPAQRGKSAVLNGIFEKDGKFIANFSTGSSGGGQFNIVKDSKAELAQAIRQNFAQVNNDILKSYKSSFSKFSGFGDESFQNFAALSLIDDGLLSERVVKASLSRGETIYFDAFNWEANRKKLLALDDRQLKELGANLRVTDVPRSEALSTFLERPIGKHFKINALANAMSDQGLIGNGEIVNILEGKYIVNEIDSIINTVGKDKIQSIKTTYDLFKNLSGNNKKLKETLMSYDDNLARQTSFSGNLNQQYINSSTFGGKISSIKGKIAKSENVEQLIYEQNGKFKMAIFNRSRSDVISRTLLNGQPISASDAAIIEIPALDELGTIAFGSQKKANILKARFDGTRGEYITSSAIEMLDGIEKRAESIAKNISKGDVGKAQYIIKKTLQENYARIPTTDRYGKEFLRSLNSSNRSNAIQKSQLVDISDFIGQFSKDGKFDSMYGTDVTNVMRDIFGYSSESGKKFSKADTAKILSVRSQLERLGITKDTIDLSGQKAENLWARGYVSIFNARKMNPLGYLNEGVKDNIRASLNYRIMPGLPADRYAPLFKSQFDDEARAVSLRFLNLNDKQIQDIKAARIKELTGKKDTASIKAMEILKGNKVYNSLSTYEGSMVLDKRYAPLMDSQKEKVFKFNPGELVLEDIKVGQELKKGQIIARNNLGAESSDISDLIFSGRYGGKVKNIIKDQDGLINVVTELNMPAVDGIKFGSVGGGLKATGNIASSELLEALFPGQNIAGIINMPMTDTSNTADIVTGTISAIGREIKKTKDQAKYEEFVSLINQVFFKGRDLARLENGKIALEDMSREAFEDVFMSKTTRSGSSAAAYSVFKQLEDFKLAASNRFGINLVKNATEFSYGGITTNILDIALQVQDVDQTAKIYGSTGKGSRLGFRDWISYKHSDNFYKSAISDYDTDGAALLKGAFQRVINQNEEQSRKMFSSYSYGLLSIGKDSARIEDLFNLEESGWLGKNKSIFENIKSYDLAKYDDSKVLRSITYNSTLSDTYIGSLNKEAIEGTILDKNIFEGKAGIRVALPEKINIDKVGSDIDSIFIPNTLDPQTGLPKRVDGAYAPNRVAQKADSAIRRIEDFYESKANGTFTEEHRSKMIEAVQEYYKVMGNELTTNHGEFMQTAYSGRTKRSTYLTAKGMNIYDYKNAINNGTLKENTLFMSENNIRELLSGADEKKLGVLYEHMSGGKGTYDGIASIINLMETNDAEIPALNLRYPNIGTGSMQAEGIRLGKGLGDDVVTTTLGAHLRKGGDWDGDAIAQFLFYLSDSEINEKNMGKVLKTLAQQRDLEAVASQATADWAIAKFERSSRGLDGLSFKDISALDKYIFNQEELPTNTISHMQKQFGNVDDLMKEYFAYMSEHMGQYGTKVQNLEFESRAGKIIGGMSNLSLQYRSFAANLAEQDQSMAGASKAMQAVSQITQAISESAEQAVLSSKHIGKASTDQLAEMITASTRLQTAFRAENFKAENVMSAMQDLGVFDSKGAFTGRFGTSLNEQLKQIGMEGLEGMTDQELASHGLSALEGVLSKSGLRGAHTKSALARFGIASEWELDDENIRMLSTLTRGGGGQEELAPVFGEIIKNVGIKKEQSERLINHIATAAENINTGSSNVSSIANNYYDDAADFVNTKLKGAIDGAFSVENIKAIAPYAAIAAGVMGVTGMISAPSVKRKQIEARADEAPSSDGEYVDPVLYQTLQQSAPMGAGPTARVQPMGRAQKMNVKISGSATKGLTNDELTAIIEGEIRSQTALPINLNITSKDERTSIDRSWVQNEFLRAINS